MKLVRYLLTAITFALLPTVSAAAASVPQFYFENSSVSANKGEAVHLDLHVNAHGTPLDTVSVVVKWDASALQFTGLDTSQSKFSAFVPSVPVAGNGKLAFSASVLGSTVDSDVLIGGLDFTGLASSRSVTVSLDGSAAASNGKPIDAGATDTAVYLGSQSGAAAGKAVAISDIKITSRTIIGGTVQWQTDVPSTSSISYGDTTRYGLVANSDELSTKHSLPLQNVFRGKTTVHFRITSRSEDGRVGTSEDQRFTTVGYKVQLTMLSSDNQPLADRTVSLTGQQTARTDNQGVATFSDIAPGTIRIHTNGLHDQYITVAGLKDAAASNTQTFTIHAQRASGQASQFLAGGLLVILLAAVWLLRRHHRQISGK